MLTRLINGVIQTGFKNKIINLRGYTEGMQKKTFSIRPYHTLHLSAATEPSLNKKTKEYINLLQNSTSGLANICTEAAYTNEVYPYRLAVCAKTHQEMITKLKKATHKTGKPLLPDSIKPEIVFMFPGQGSQYVNMGRSLYETEHLFAENIDRCFTIIKDVFGENLKPCLYPKYPDTNPDEINRTDRTQLIIFIFEYALARLIMSWGITPTYLIGHSLGEYSALCLSGVLSLKDTLIIMYNRAKLMALMPMGKMLSVKLSVDELLPILPKSLDLAAVNSPQHTVISGPSEEIESFDIYLTKNDIFCSQLRSSHAYHSRMLEPMLKDINKIFNNISFSPMMIPIISTLTGEAIPTDYQWNTDYFINHIRKPVLFYDAISKVIGKKDIYFIEVGPGKTLFSLLKSHNCYKHQKIVHMIKHPKDNTSDAAHFFRSAAKLWQNGLNIDFKSFYNTAA